MLAYFVNKWGGRMRVNLSKLLPQKVTIINRLKSKDNESKRDKFYKKTLDNCIWDKAKLANQSGKAIYYSNGYSVQIPTEQNCKYKDYREWITDIENSFTLSLDDYVILGEVTEDITPDNLKDIINRYSPNVFKISSINIYNSQDGISTNSNNFALKYANIYYVEGD